MGVAALQSRFPKTTLSWWYVAALAVSMGCYLWLKSIPENIHVPQGWPDVVQNAIRGPYSVFPLVPWLGFAFLGGAIGVAVRKYKDRLGTEKSCLWFFALAALLKLIWIVSVTIFPSEGLAWFTERSSQVVAFLGLLRWIEIRFGIGVPRLLCCGRMTFEIYIAHVIVLYGGIFGIGLNGWISESPESLASGSGCCGFHHRLFLVCAGCGCLEKQEAGVNNVLRVMNFPFLKNGTRSLKATLLASPQS